MSEFLQAMAQGVLIGSTYGLLALGMGLLYGVSGVVNFSHGDFISLGMFLCLALYSALSLDPYVSVFITVPVMMAALTVVSLAEGCEPYDDDDVLLLASVQVEDKIVSASESKAEGTV